MSLTPFSNGLPRSDQSDRNPEIVQQSSVCGVITLPGNSFNIIQGLNDLPERNLRLHGRILFQQKELAHNWPALGITGGSDHKLKTFLAASETDEHPLCLEVNPVSLPGDLTYFQVLDPTGNFYTWMDVFTGSEGNRIAIPYLYLPGDAKGPGGIAVLTSGEKPTGYLRVPGIQVATAEAVPDILNRATKTILPPGVVTGYFYPYKGNFPYPQIAKN